jgi:transposase
MFKPVALGRKLNIQEKAAIVALNDREISVREITQQMSCSRNTVKKWIRRCEETRDVQRKVGSEMKKKTTPAPDARLLMAIAAKPITSLQEVKGNYSQSYFYFYP